MAEVIYSFPDTKPYPYGSCQCCSSLEPGSAIAPGNPTNMSVTDCSFNECPVNDVPNPSYNVFNIQHTPHVQTGYTLLNPNLNVITGGGYDYTWDRIDCPDDVCCKTTYVSHDPRLIDVRRNVLTKLDRPPYDSELRLKDIYDKSLTGYGQKYTGYFDVNAGSVAYYTDKQLENAFYEPNFILPSSTIAWVYKDPMGSIQPQYERFIDSSGMDTPCLSWIADSTFQREDIMSKQMYRPLQQRWSSRWQNGS